MMLCDINVVFNSFADAFGLISRKLSSRQVLVRFQSSKSLAASNMPAVVHSCANIWSTRSASTLMGCHAERLRQQSLKKPRDRVAMDPGVCAALRASIPPSCS